MYSDKENINLLTSLLVAHGIRHVVVCPGSRNAPLVHNFTECPDLHCHPVTDERSAGFYALGMSLALDSPVAVCVTSGSALLNLSPAVAESSYQHHGIVVISADRPQSWIDQLDGQTLPQRGAFGGLVSKCVTLPEVHDADTRWYCNRLVNEALCAVCLGGRKSVHINVPLSEPLFQFDVPQLPLQRVIRFGEPSAASTDSMDLGLMDAFCKARRPMIVMGQYHHFDREDVEVIQRLQAHAVVLYEPLSHPEGGLPFDELLNKVGADERFLPDFLLYGGDTVVSKRLKQFLRHGVDNVFEITADGEIHDTFQRVSVVLREDARTVLRSLAEVLATRPRQDSEMPDTSAFVGLWQQHLREAVLYRQSYRPAYSQMAAVKLFEHRLSLSPAAPFVHYANSSAVRLANVYARHFVWCNRGVNGIEGSLSTAAGHSLVTDSLVCCVIGDLSFFYDGNALWNRQLRGNLRILLLNNGGGGIFCQLPVGDGRSSALPSVMATHHVSAEGICQSYGVRYLSARDESMLEHAMTELIESESDCPVLLEVFTDAAEDARIYQDYYKTL